MEKFVEIKFGILIDKGITNRAKMDFYRKIDTFHYLKKISNNYEDIENEINIFREEANKISKKDSEIRDWKTEYFLVCYVECGDKILTKTIRQLFF